LGNQLKYIIYRCLGILGVFIAFLLVILKRDTLFLNFVVTFITFGISVATKLLVNNYTTYRRKKVIHLLTLNHITRLLILLFSLYFMNTYHYEGAQMAGVIRLILQVSVLDGINIYIILKIPSFCRKDKIETYSIVGMMALGLFICRFIEIKYVSIVSMTIYIICLTVISITYINWNKWMGTFLNHQPPYCKMYAFITIIEFLVLICSIGQWRKYFLVIITCNLVQAVYLLLYTYNSCVFEPWKCKIEEIHNADNLIEGENETCDMIVNLSHELKTPVNVINSALELLALDYQEEPKAMHEILSIKKDCNQVMGIIQNMIDIQKIKGDYIEFKYHNYNLVAVIENVIDAFKAEIEQSNFLFNPLEEEIYQQIDIDILQQCFMLLFDLIMKNNMSSQLYIEIGIVEECGETYMMMQHDQINRLEELDRQKDKEIQKEEEVLERLTATLIELILKAHKIEWVYGVREDKKNIKMTFPRCFSSGVEEVSLENINYLRGQIRARGILADAIN